MPITRSLPPLSQCAPDLHTQLQRSLASFEHELSQRQSLGAAVGPVYEVLQIALPYVLKHHYVLDEEQDEFFGWACCGTECIYQDVYERNQGFGLNSYEIARTFTLPLLVFLGLFAELSADRTLTGLLPSLRSALVANTAQFFEVDPDINPELLLPSAEALYDDIETVSADEIGDLLQRFRDAQTLNHVHPFETLPSVEDPIRRYSEQEIEGILASSVTGYGRPSVPRFGDGPRLKRLQDRLQAIKLGRGGEAHLRPTFEQTINDLLHRRDYLAQMNSKAKQGIGFWAPSDRHLH